MANESIVALPQDLSDPVVLRRVLSVIVTTLDTVIGNRGGAAHTLSKDIVKLEARVKELENVSSN